MPVTQGHGNPDWSRDETILALDLLYRHGKPVDRKHPEVQRLSEILRAAVIHPPEKRNERFRNPDGVALKLQNLFSAVEPGRGLTYSKTDFSIVTDFPLEKKNELSEVATAIRTMLTNIDDGPGGRDEVDEVFVEGRWLTARHRSRDIRLRMRLLESRRQGILRCEICDFEPPPFDRSTQESFFEAHHILPLAAAEGMRSTKVSEMVLLCACCHRFIHKLISTEARWVLPDEARNILQSGEPKASLSLQRAKLP
ncbi:HNH endonuclease [Neorhizobium galegae]|uniref:HNH endonuclease n=1 Tax=Neorhizobium galegae TaxID=399 RepID=UPI00210392D6|nr:HNH endonuclease [Neorhizobium galegae]MCQ1772883.1 HNH endonuclease [Neorhizobium galegae]MCQ1799170.1 HNH endonuclease [Neorhizobium galegae]